MARAKILVAALLSALPGTVRADPPAAGPLRDTAADTWAATDALGRRVPVAPEVGPPRPDRFVGLFYFLWLGAHVNGGPWDITKILGANPDAMRNPAAPPWGPLHAMHHWGEPLFGYYVTDDEYVLRKHAQMISDAGVDVIIFDVTNQSDYKPQYASLLKVFAEVRRDGGRTPQVAFLCPFGDSAPAVTNLYRHLYAPGLHSDLWFRWEGKPLLLANPGSFRKIADMAERDAIRNFFTIRRPQPDYFRGPVEPDMWGWLEVHPQHVFRNARGEKEQMTAGVAQNAVDGRLGSMSETGAHGRSWHEGKADPAPGAADRGLNFAEQWERVLAEDPKFVFVTGWNEWIAMRFDAFNGVRLPIMFVDTFDQEHSRDIEPMKGGHGDAYYYQLASYVRRFKGARPPPAAGPPKTIRIDGGFAPWADVAPEYLDDAGDTAHRDHDGYNQCARYVDRSGRNDIVAAKVARDDRNVYFYVKTRKPLTPRTDPQWMTLFIDADRDRATGWEGYDFVVNRTVKDPATAVLERNAGGWSWTPAGEAPMAAAGSELHLAIPRAALGLEKGPLRFDFKWADNVPYSGDISEFITTGDVAPNGRFNYRYQE